MSLPHDPSTKDNSVFVLQVGVPSAKEQYVHRTGRSARAGKSGKGLLLLAEWETFFLRDVRDLPIKAWSGAPPTTTMDPALRRSLSAVRPSRTPSLCTRSTRAGIEWCCCHRAVCMARPR